MGIGYEIGSAVAGLAGGIYDLWAKERDFDYQKSLQNTIFKREDTAIQRRMADLKAAGLNPNLAAGSAAGAGAVVGRSNTVGNPIGTALDSAAAVQQLRAQREQNEILRNQKTMSEYNADLARYEYGAEKMASILDRAQMYKMMGVDDLQVRFSNDGVSLWSPKFQMDGKKYYKLDLDNSPLMKQLDWQIQNNKNAADMLQKDNQFYVADKIGEYLGIGASIFGGAGSGYLNFRKANNLNNAYRRY